MINLYNEDFRDFPLDEFPYDRNHSALGEYHFIEPDGYCGNWYDPISLHQWRSKDGSWLITSDGINRFMEQNRGDEASGAFASVYSMLMLKDKIWVPYTIETAVLPFYLKEPVGVAFGYLTSRNYYAFLFTEKTLKVIYRHEEDFTTLAEVEYTYENMHTYKVKLEVGAITKVYVDDKLVITTDIDRYVGLCGLVAKSSARYSSFAVDVTEANFAKQAEAVKRESARLTTKRLQYSELECIKKINLTNFGSARQLRIANQDGKTYFLFAQHQKRLYRDSFAHLSCLTCCDYDGKVLWQKGEPCNDISHTRISCDLPFQVSDINNDGKLEVIYAQDFTIYICDLITGVVLKKAYTPIINDDPLVKNEPFYRLNVDAIRVADFEGLGYQGDLIVKDRYQNVWALNQNLEILWRYHHKNTGHFPYIGDFNNDGLDEMLVGYDMVDAKGNLVWSLPMNSDHTDEIIYGQLEPLGKKYFVLASGNEGMNIVNGDGTIFKHNEIGHAQRISVADYDPNRYGYEIVATAFWGSPGITCIYDYQGNLLKEIELKTSGNLVTPVAFDGRNVLFLSNASATEGGLYDSELDLVVKFPSDARPTLCCEVFDLDNDGIDEILCWDENSMWIYKAKEFVRSTIEYDKYPHNAFSNYRGEYLIPKDK